MLSYLYSDIRPIQNTHIKSKRLLRPLELDKLFNYGSDVLDLVDLVLKTSAPWLRARNADHSGCWLAELIPNSDEAFP